MAGFVHRYAARPASPGGACVVSRRLRLLCRRPSRKTQTSVDALGQNSQIDLVDAAGAGDVERLRGRGAHGHAGAHHPDARQGSGVRIQVVPGGARKTAMPSAAGRRLLEALDRPKRGRELAEDLGIGTQRLHRLAVSLHGQGLLKFADQERILHIVSRQDDQTPLLSRDEERVLSAIPREYATNLRKIGIAARLAENGARQILARLLANGLVETLDGLRGEAVYKITAAGQQHPQRGEPSNRAEAPPLPVRSERVRTVLSTILSSGSLRIRDVTEALKIPPDSVNALMQYLKRKALVQKTSLELQAPYALTDKGHRTLAEMTRRQAA
jgi:predicted transcriptional regulator